MTSRTPQYHKNSGYRIISKEPNMPNYDNFLSASQLGITESELDAFTRTLRRFETNPPERRPHEYGALRPSFSRVKFFDMGSTITKAAYECGAVACLFGWAHHLAPDLLELSDCEAELSPPLARLCGYAAGSEVNWNATVPQAAATLRHFLETAAVDWTLAAKEPAQEPASI